MVDQTGARGSVIIQNHGMQELDRTQNLRMGRIGDHRIELGQGNREPTRGAKAVDTIKSFFSEIGDFFKSIGNKISTAYNDWQVSRAEAREAKAFERTRQDLSNLMPPGVTVSEDGTISGTHVVTGFGDHESQGVNRGKSVGQWFTDMGASQLKVPPPPKEMQTINGIHVGSQSVKDLYRLDLTVQDTVNGVYQAKEDPVKGPKRNENVVTALRNFAGDDNTTSVLTAVINQQFSQIMTDSWSKPDGSTMGWQINQGKLGPIAYRDQTGTESQVQPGGIGTAPINLERLANGDFKVTIDFDMYFSQSGRNFNKQDFPGLEGAAIKGHGHLEMIIDHNDAANKIATVSVPNPVTITFEGHMAT